MTTSLSDVLRTARSLSARIRQRDTVAEGNRRIACSLLTRLDASLEPDMKAEKMPNGERNLTISDPLPELIQDCPTYRTIHEDNQKLYLIVAEQQLTLEMIMAKYRTEVSRSISNVQHFLSAQKCLDTNDGILGSLLHEKGVALQTMSSAVWQDDVCDMEMSQYAAEISLDNATLNEVVGASLRFNGGRYLKPLPIECDIQTVAESTCGN